jgi:8-oxo-dGTP pyrophosphatase MutT (NUDIX family)
VKSIRNTLLRNAYRLGWRALRVYWRIAKPEKRGVKCLLTRGDEILLVRHTYGDGRRWEVPGGGVKRREEPLAAARREAREELGVDVPDWRLMGDLFEQIDGKRDRLWCFTSEIGAERISADEAEIAELRWFRRDAVPAEAHRYVGRILAL